MQIYGVVGWKNSGKTGLMERLVKEVTGRGFSVSTVKHAHHSFDVDHPGKDSHRHRVAGDSHCCRDAGPARRRRRLDNVARRAVTENSARQQFPAKHTQ